MILLGNSIWTVYKNKRPALLPKFKDEGMRGDGPSSTETHIER